MYWKLPNPTWNIESFLDMPEIRWTPELEAEGTYYVVKRSDTGEATPCRLDAYISSPSHLNCLRSIIELSEIDEYMYTLEGFQYLAYNPHTHQIITAIRKMTEEPAYTVIVFYPSYYPAYFYVVDAWREDMGGWFSWFPIGRAWTTKQACGEDSIVWRLVTYKSKTHMSLAKAIREKYLSISDTWAWDLSDEVRADFGMLTAGATALSEEYMVRYGEDEEERTFWLFAQGALVHEIYSWWSPNRIRRGWQRRTLEKRVAGIIRSLEEEKL